VKHVRVLYAAECPALGEPGILIRGMSGDDLFAATDPRLLAHDLMEHYCGPEAIGSTEDEFRALGTTWYARGAELGTYPLSYDVANVLADCVHKGCVDAPEHAPVEADGALLEIMWKARETARAEVEHQTYNRSECAESLWHMRRHAHSALNYMRAGYQHAENTYGSRYAASRLFHALSDATTEICKHAEEYSGMEWTITWDDDSIRTPAETVQLTESWEPDSEEE
jgi:hypothetical protein